MKPLRKQRNTFARRRDKKQRLGAAVVEFAVVANTLFLVIFACIEFTRINLIRNTSQDAAYYAARSAMVSGATSQDAIDVANNLLNSVGTTGATVTVNDGTPLSPTTSEINVKITVPYHANALLVPMFIPDKNFVVESKMKAERYEFFYDGTN